MSKSIESFVAHRVKALATVFLTRRRDLRLSWLQDSELDCLVTIGSGGRDETEAVESFGVILTGTIEPLPSEREATRYLNAWWTKHEDEGTRFYFPVIILLFTMEDDRGYSAWRSEPRVVQETIPQLVYTETFRCERLTKESLDGIVERVSA
jgi:hypothetical protein